MMMKNGKASDGDEPSSVRRGLDSAEPPLSKLVEIHAHVEQALEKLLPQALQAHYEDVYMDVHLTQGESEKKNDDKPKFGAPPHSPREF